MTIKNACPLVLSLFLGWFSPLVLMGQTSFAHLENLNIEDGLSQNSVTCILQDSRGLMWFGTEDGLNSYDGYSFKHFKHKPYDTLSLGASIVSCIVEDSSQNLWIGTTNGLSKLNLKDHSIARFPLPNAIYSGLGTTIIHDMILGGNGNLIAATYDGILDFQMGSGDYKIFKPQPHQSHPLGQHNRTLLKYSQHEVWVGSNHGVIVYNQKNHTVEPLKGPLAQHLAGQVVYKLMKDRQQQVWISTGKGLFRYDPETEALRQFRLDPQPELNRFGIIDIFQDSNGYYWVGSYQNIPYVLKPGDDTFRPLKVLNNIGSSHSIPSIYEDDSGIIWLGSYTGVFKFDPNRWKFQHFKESHTAANNFEVIPGVRGFAENEHGNILVVSSGAGIHQFDPQKKQLNQLTDYFAKFIPDFNINIKCVLWDSHGYLWIGLWHQGLYRINLQTKEYQYYQAGNSQSTIRNSSVRSLLEDPDGDIWIATYGGLHRYRHQTDEFQIFLESEDDQGLTDAGVQVLFLDSQNYLWAGTTRGGLNKFDFETNTFQKFSYQAADSSGISYNYITSFAETPKGILWIGTYGGGLNRFDMERGLFRHYNTSHGLPNDVIYGLLNDPHGNLWISSNAGLTLFNAQSESFRNYDVNDGLQSNEFNSGSYFRSSSGQLFFGGINGFNAFYADSITDNRHTPKMLFTDFQVHNRSLQPGPDSPLKATISHTDHIELNHDQAVFSFQFAALNYTDPLKNQYAYQLVGFDDDWQYLGTRNFITFTNIDPGAYTLRVKGSNNDGIWNEEGLTMTIKILPPWWLSNWAYVLYGCLIAAALVFWRSTVVNRERLKAQYQLEHLKLEKAQEMDRVKSTFFENISHEFRTPLTLIQGPLESIFKKGVPKELQAPYQVMINNSRRLHELIDQLMDLSKLEAGKMKLSTRYLDLVPLVKAVFDMFDNQDESGHITMELDIRCQSLWLWYDQDKIQKILYNLISNACKFTEQGTIRVSLELVKDQALIEVCDTGPGIPIALQEKIFERFYQTSSGEAAQQGTGIGLALTKELVDLHGGEISVRSAEGQGACFSICLPVTAGPGAVETSENEPMETQHRSWLQREVEHWDTAEESNGHFKVLIVEDQPELRGFLKNILSEYYQVVTAENGLEGWNQALNEIPDLIISDIRMPEMDGFTLCQKLKEDRRTSHIPVVLLTAKSSKPNKIKGLEIGADDYLIKPFDEDELIALLKNRLRQRELLRKQFSRSIYLEPAKLALTSTDETFLKQALQVMEQNMDNPDFKVEAFTKEMGMSRTQMHRKLKALTDQNTTAFMRSIRLKRAAQLLKENHGNVSEVSDTVGFNRVSTFIKEFRKVYQITPLQYRKEHLLQRP